MATHQINTVAAQSELMSEIAAGEQMGAIESISTPTVRVSAPRTVRIYAGSAIQVYVKVDGRNVPATLTQPEKLERVIAALTAEGYTVSRCRMIDLSFSDL